MVSRLGLVGSAARGFPLRAGTRAFPAPRFFSVQTARQQEVRDAYIISASRTPTAKFNGSFLTVSAPQLGAAAIRSALEKSKIPVEKVTDVYMGNVLQGSIGQAPARQAVIFSGLPKSVEAVTINKVCASGLKAVVFAAQNIQLGLSDVQIAGGMENMSQVPYYVPRASSLPSFGHVKMEDGLIKDGLTDVYDQFHMGICAETTAKKHDISRETQDQYAIQSYERAQAAWKNKAFADEIVPVTVKGRKGDTVVDTDEGYLDIKLEKVPTLKPAFIRDGTGTVTAANSSTLNDGASALVLGSKEIAQEFGEGSRVLARICGSADAAVDPVDFPVAPAKAVPIALERAGITKDQVAVWEFNEAFAAVIKANEKILGLENATVNPLGGAISLGHALGSSGSRILTTLLHQLKVGEYGVAAICNGGGAATAIVVQRVSSPVTHFNHPNSPLPMAVSTQFLSGIRDVLKSLNGEALRDWLKVEPPLPQEYYDLAAELKSGYQDDAAVQKLVESCLPEEEDVPEGQGTTWPGFLAFAKDYLEYWRDVDFEDLLGAHQLLTTLTNSCATALNNPTYGTIMLQTSISLCNSLSTLSMTLNKRPDLTMKLDAFHTGEEERKSVIETTAEIMQKFFTTCLTDRSGTRFAPPTGKKVGIYIFANKTLKLLTMNFKSYLAAQLLTNIMAKSPPLAYYPAAQRVTFLYFLGRFHFNHTHYWQAAQCFQEAYLQTPPRFQKHRRLILIYLIPCMLIQGRLPSQKLLQRPEAQPMARVYSQLSYSIRTGNYILFQHIVSEQEEWLRSKGLRLLVTIQYRLRPLIWRSLSRRIFLMTYVTPAEGDSRKAVTLELRHLVTAMQYIQKRLEGYLPAQPVPKGRPANVNSIFLKAGVYFGNLAVTPHHVEFTVAALVGQDLLHGYIAHTQFVFAIMGTKQKGSAVAAGWPRVSEVIDQQSVESSVPGWVKEE
ncbi:thiolase [Hypoxylon sp. NC1633]|nr:thiolase [Hypoxylon sp. NC1633]